MSQEIWSGPITITVGGAPTPQKISYTTGLKTDKLSGTAPLTVNFTLEIVFSAEVAIGVDAAYLEINGQRVRLSTIQVTPVPATKGYSMVWDISGSYTFTNPGTYQVRMGAVISRIIDAQGNQYTLGYTEIWSNTITVKGLEAGDWFAGVLTGMLAVPVLSMGVQKLREWYAKRGGFRLRR